MKDENVVSVAYHHTGKSTNTNNLGMRAMQARVYEKRNSKYLLVKAPPASGKSRALMFVALDKLANQDIKKVIVAVPERSIGRSFKNTDLTTYGFYEDWVINPYYDLTSGGSTGSNVKRFVEFLDNPEAKVLICTHATLRFAYEEVADDVKFNDTMIAIDEFHHVSAADNSVLGTALKNIMHNSTAHILAMTGSYFRGDSQPILTTEDERQFDKINYSYYEQLDGYKYLKSFGIDYKFYQGTYLDALEKALDTDKKTIIHIPSVNSAESTKDKYEEVGHIEDAIGDFQEKDPNTGIDYVKRKSDGKILKVADLVTEEGRDKVQAYLRDMSSADDLDIIIALGMAKEGFDWPWAEYALTIGYRGSLTEIVQIIGRVTRDSSNKTHAQFTNLIAQPDAKNDDVMIAVNTILKAITASLLMEQVLAPELKLKPKSNKPAGDGDSAGNGTDGTIFIRGLKEPSTQRVRDIIENDLPDLKAAILQDTKVQEAIASKADADILNKVLIPKVIMEQNPDLSDDEIEEVRQYTIAEMALKQAETQDTTSKSGEDKKFLRMADKFINVDDLDINLIEQVNPFQRAYEVISSNIDSKTLRLIQQTIDSKKSDIPDDELVILYPKIKQFILEHNRYPSRDSNDELEVKYAYALARIRDLKMRKGAKNG
ncbi:DEAD/DEAH box helicase family protein [Ligilactobacillus agilis]|nr:DEAD/DEAH box helicase family protein [Ligilactobacillus agilis]